MLFIFDPFVNLLLILREVSTVLLGHLWVEVSDSTGFPVKAGTRAVGVVSVIIPNKFFLLKVTNVASTLGSVAVWLVRPLNRAVLLI